MNAPLAPSESTARPPKSSARGVLEDFAVSACGLATSAAVAYGAVAISEHWQFAVYTWMADFVLPIGAILCGFVASIGYWLGARWFNHRPSRLLMGNIVVVSLTTFFWIHDLNYSHAKVNGRPVAKLMSFPEYLIAVTEHMTYRSSQSEGPGVQLGKWGWGVAGLQVLGFCFGGFAVYAMLASTSYCERCRMYYNQVWRRVSKWKDVAEMARSYDTVAQSLAGGHLQAAMDHYTTLGEKRLYGIRGLLTMDLRKCPGCESRLLRLIAQKRNGKNYTTIAKLIVPTEEPLHKPAANLH